MTWLVEIPKGRGASNREGFLRRLHPHWMSRVRITPGQPVQACVSASAEALAEERELVRKIIMGDARAFEEFAEHYIPYLQRFARKRVTNVADEARDIVQSTICKAIEKLGTWRGESPLLVWLYACCRNEIASRYRGGRNRHEVGADFSDENLVVFASGADGPDVDLLRGEEEKLVHSALGLLPPRYASVLEWKYIEELPVASIAERLGLSVKGAESTLTRARDAFRIVFSDLQNRNG